MSRPDNDLYAILGLVPDATQDQIRHAYRALLRRHHPDTRAAIPGGRSAAASDSTLQQVLAAYAILGDTTRRAAYDQRAGTGKVVKPAHDRPWRTAYAGQSPIQAGPVHWHTGPG
jgi:curved DNA-binding protein CbpA